MSELSALKPHLRMVVALGSVATKALLDTRKGVTWMRGRIMEFPSLDCDFAATYHPAAVLRNPELYPDMLFDLKRVAEHVNGQRAERSVRNEYYLAQTEEEALAILEECKEAGTFSFDLETDSGEAINFQSDRVLQINLCWAPGRAGVIPASLFTDRVLRALATCLTDRRLFRIAHNAKFDAKFAAILLHGFLPGPVRCDFDTMLAHLMFDERRGTHALYSVAPRFVGLDTYEHLIQPYLPTRSTPFSAVPPEVLALYGARDADCEYRLGVRFVQDLKGQPFEGLYYKVIMPAVNAFAEAELKGLTVDVEYANQLSQQLEQQIKEAERQLSRGGTVNLRSPKQLSAVLYDEVGIPLPKEGKRTTAQGYLVKVRHQFDYVDQLLKFREADKLHGTYLRKLITKAKEHPQHLVFPDYQLHGTVTGRLSERGTGIMTIPRVSWMRKVFVAREGHVFVGLDYASAELCWTAVYSKDPVLTAIINSGRDIHTEVAQEMFRKTPEQWAKLTEDQQKQLRIYAKAVVFGLLYGRGPRSLSEQLGITVDEAESYIRRFFDRFQGVQDWAGRVQHRAVRERELTTVYGRKRRFGFITEDTVHVVKRQALNFLPSSSSNDMTLVTYVRAWQKLGFAGPIYLHDGIVLEVPEDEAAEVAREVKKIATEHIPEVVDTPVRFRADISIGRSWGELKEADL
jgi:DNA polymerase-1